MSESIEGANEASAASTTPADKAVEEAPPAGAEAPARKAEATAEAAKAPSSPPAEKSDAAEAQDEKADATAHAEKADATAGNGATEAVKAEAEKAEAPEGEAAAAADGAPAAEKADAAADGAPAEKADATEPTAEKADAAADGAPAEKADATEPTAEKADAAAEGAPAAEKADAAEKTDAAADGAPAAEKADAAEPTAENAADEKSEAPAEAAPAEAAPAEEPPAVKEPDPPPSIEGIEPGRGPLAGGTVITIVGAAFAEGCEVHIGGEPASVHRESDARLVVTTPAMTTAGEVEIRVSNPDGQSDTRGGAFHFDAPPVLTGAEPSTVSVKGGTVVTLLGNDLAEGCAVLVDGASVPVARAHSGRLEAVVSAHPTGIVDVVVKNPDGQRATLAGLLRYEEPPVVEGISPDRGVTAGGTEVVLQGQCFQAGCAVLFGGEPAEGVRFVSETELRVPAPSHNETELVSITVVNPSGISHRVPNAFTYERAAPKVASVSPAFGPNDGGTRLTLTGTDFDAKCAAFVCGIPAKVTWKSRELIEVVTPPVARDGLVDVRIVNVDDQAFVAEKVFRYDAPLPPCVLTAVNPTTGSQVGGTKVLLFGEDFAEGAKVRFGGVAAEARFMTRKQLEAVAPAYAGSGEVPVEVENPDGVVSTLEKAFNYEARPAPAITSVSPPNGPTTGGTKIVIEGANFTPDCQVYVGREYPKDQVVKSATEIHAVVAPRKTPGVVDIEVAAPGLPKAVAKNGFRYDAVPAPIITSVSPTAGAVAGGTEMSIAGKNFRKDSIVLVDGKQPKTVKFIDAQNLEFKTPPGESGKMVDVIVRNPDGKEAVQKRAFMYDPRYR